MFRSVHKNMDNEIQARRLKYYLKQYWVKPSGKHSFIAEALRDKPRFYVYDCSSLDETYQVGQTAILSYNEHIYWASLNAYSFIESYLQNEPVMSDALDPQLLIITFLGSEVSNKMLLPLINQIGYTREAEGLTTLVLCVKPQPALIGTRIQPQSKKRSVV